MINHPFPLFRPYTDRFWVRLLDRSDDTQNDQTIAQELIVDDIASLHQVHGNNIVLIREPTHRTINADGLMTNVHNLTLTIRAADCQMFVAYDPERHVAGLLHAGWRGLVAKAIPAFIQALQHELGAEPSRLLIGAGPSLCMRCAEFIDPVEELPGIDPRFFRDRNADLRSIAEFQFYDLGIRPENFDRDADCTTCDNDRWFSYRGRDKEAVMNGVENVLACTLL